jgi:hypothetical protein
LLRSSVPKGDADTVIASTIKMKGVVVGTPWGAGLCCASPEQYDQGSVTGGRRRKSFINVRTYRSTAARTSRFSSLFAGVGVVCGPFIKKIKKNKKK